MPKYRTTKVDQGFHVTEIMSFFTTCFDSASVSKNRGEIYPFWAMIYTVKGHLRFRIGEKEYEVHSGQVIFYPPSMMHSIVEIEGKSWEVSFLTFQCDSPRMEHFRDRVIVPDGATLEELRRLFAFGGEYFYNLPEKDGVVGMHCSADPDTLMQIKAMIENALIGLYRRRVGERVSRSRAVFLSAVAYMEANIGSKISLSQLAMEAGVSVSTLKTAFSRESGGGVNSYYIDMKLKKGAEWLRITDMTVGEISEGLGFSSQFYFSELFKKRYGQSPSAYRKKQEEAWRELL